MTLKRHVRNCVLGICAGTVALHAAPAASPEQSLPQQFPGQFVDVAAVPASATADGDAENRDLLPFDSRDDPVPLADGAHTAEASKLADEGFSLLRG